MLKPYINQIITLNVHNIGNSGEGVGSSDGYTVFVDGALPDETVEIRLSECQKNYGRGELLSIKKSSPFRAAPPCPLFGKCGGCQLMHLSYAQQLKVKQQRVIDALQRIGKISGINVKECLPSPSPLAYRNKIQVPVRGDANGLKLGLYARSSHDLVEMENCYIHCSLGEDVYKKINKIIKAADIQAYDPITGKGELRHVLIKSAVHTEQVLVILVTGSKITPNLTRLSKKIMQECPSVKGVVHNLNTQRNNVILGNRYEVISGSGFINEKICGMTFKVSPASFFQVNPAQAENLYRQALNFANLQGTETVLDAYCGVGTLSLLFAHKAKKVIGVECVPEAIKDAQENSKLNDIPNVSFICENAENLIKKLSHIDVAILNPPRKGCDLAFLKGIENLKPKKIIYISCDPATLARDLAILQKMEYQIKEVQPFDMFPQTAHVETVVSLSIDYKS